MEMYQEYHDVQKEGHADYSGLLLEQLQSSTDLA